MSNEFKSGDEIFISFLDEKDIQRDLWAYVVEVGMSASIVKTKSGSVMFIPVQRILKLKKKGEA